MDFAFSGSLRTYNKVRAVKFSIKMDAAVLALIISVVVCFIILSILWIPMTGMVPKPVLQCWTHVMRATKCGDQYGWNWSKVEDRLYIGTLPRIKEDLIELRDTEDVFAVVTMNEEWCYCVSPECYILGFSVQGTCPHCGRD